MFDLILIDFSWLYNKYFYVAKYQAKTKGIPLDKVSAYVGTLVIEMLSQFLHRIEDKYFTSKILCVLDTPTSALINTSEEYKQNRNKEEKKEVYKNLNETIAALAENPKLTFIKSKGYEADQVIASLAEKYCDSKAILIYSGDKDLLQLTHYKRVNVSDKFEKGKFLIKSDKEIFEKFKNSKGEDFTRISEDKRDILKYRVLKGDPSDNLSPIFPRIKDAEIISIIQEYWKDQEILDECRANSIIASVKESNPKLAEKLESGLDNWVKNYKLMNLHGIKDLKVSKVVGK